MTSWVFHGCRIHDECVCVTFWWYQVVLVHCILWHLIISLAQIFYQKVHISRARNFPRPYTTREKYFYLESAWLCNCCAYNVGVFHCLVLRLAMWHSCVFSQHFIPWHFIISLAQIFYQEVHISRARNFPRAYTTREKYFFLESAWDV